MVGAELVAADGNTPGRSSRAGTRTDQRSAERALESRAPVQGIQEQVASRGTLRQVGSQGSRASIPRPGYRILCLLKGNKARDDWCHISREECEGRLGLSEVRPEAASSGSVSHFS